MYRNMQLKEMTKNDFDKAYQKALFSKILSKIKGEKNTLLSFDEVMKWIRVKNESYIGLQCVRIEDIIGSEGRYNDFSKEFLPKRKNLRNRWESVDEAHYQDKILPPIKLYKLGRGYFVRDGNHRVSVAKEQGREFIDAEVTEIKTSIPIRPDMTTSELQKIVIEYEKQAFLEITGLDMKRDVSMIQFTSSGRYDEILQHIYGHQYFMGIEKNAPVGFEEAMLSWYDHIFMPIIEEIKDEKIYFRFPGRTSGDLYLWIVRQWDDLKRKYGDSVPIKDAVKSYNQNYGVSRIKYYINEIKSFLFKR